MLQIHSIKQDRGVNHGLPVAQCKSITMYSTRNIGSPNQPAPRSAGVLRQRRVPLEWHDDRDFRILAIDGGGIKGIFPAAFLAGLETRYLNGCSISGYFDLIAGTSTGGIIALGLGAGLKATALRDLYLHRGGEIFPPDGALQRGLRKAVGLFKYRYDRKVLNRIMLECLGDLTLGHSRARLCIPSCDGRHGDLYVFKTPHHPDYRLDFREKMADVAAATSAAPTYFRPFEQGGYIFLDGGVWANNPIMVGLAEALSCFDVPRERVRILSLGCGDGRYTVGKWQKSLGGLWHWRDIINPVMRFQSLSAVGQAGLLIGAERILRISPPVSDLQIDLDDWKRAAAELPAAADAALAEWGDIIASSILTDVASPYLPYYQEVANDEARPGI